MTTCLGKSFILLSVLVFRGRWSNFVCVLLSLLVLRDVILLIPDHCLSINFSIKSFILSKVYTDKGDIKWLYQDIKRVIPCLSPLYG